MLHEETLHKLAQMKLHAMVAALEELDRQRDISKLSFEDRFGLVVDREWLERQERSLKRRLRSARLREPACLEDIDYRKSRGLDRSVMRRLGRCQWIREHENVVISGATGVGKTWISCALANHACREGLSAIYKRVPRFLHELHLARADGSYVKMLAKIARFDVLILDDWGLAILDEIQRHDMLEVLEDRHGLRSTILTSQLPVAQWHDSVGDPTIADAILDRVLHNAHRIELKGPSLRARPRKSSDGSSS